MVCAKVNGQSHHSLGLIAGLGLLLLISAFGKETGVPAVDVNATVEVTWSSKVRSLSKYHCSPTSKGVPTQISWWMVLQGQRLKVQEICAWVWVWQWWQAHLAYYSSKLPEHYVHLVWRRNFRWRWLDLSSTIPPFPPALGSKNTGKSKIGKCSGRVTELDLIWDGDPIPSTNWRTRYYPQGWACKPKQINQDGQS